jgi:hypothetical protein
MMWLWLLACKPDEAICRGDRTSTFEPVLEQELRASEAGLVWTAGKLGTVVQSDACSAPPCVELRGPGEMSAFVALNREVESHFRARIWADAASRMELRQENYTGGYTVLASWSVPAGDSELDQSVTVRQPGGRIALVASAVGTLRVDEPTVSSTTWSQVEPRGEVPLHLGFLIHVEEEAALAKDEATFQRRAVILEDLAELLHSAGQRLTVQAEDNFLRGAATWDSDWFARMQALNTGWSVHLHGQTKGSDFSTALEDSVGSFAEAGIKVTDLNGGFNGTLWDGAPEVGIISLTAYKEAATQARLEYDSTQPWRPPEGSCTRAEFATDDPQGPLIYLPGASSREEDPARMAPFWARVLSQALSQTQTGRVNTWYFPMHVHDFGPLSDADFDAWLASGGWDEEKMKLAVAIQEALEPYQDRLIPSVPSEMATAYEDWEQSCSPWWDL